VARSDHGGCDRACSVAVNDLAAAANEYGCYPVSIGGDGGGAGREIPDYPEAAQLPEFGMPDTGLMDMGGCDC